MIPKFINKSKVSVTMSSDHYIFRERMYPFFDRVSRITIIRNHPTPRPLCRTKSF